MDLSLLHHLIDLDLYDPRILPGVWRLKLYPPGVHASPTNVGFARQLETIGQLNTFLLELAELAPIVPPLEGAKPTIDATMLREADWKKRTLTEPLHGVVTARELRETASLEPKVIDHIRLPVSMKRKNLHKYLDSVAKQWLHPAYRRAVIHLEVPDVDETFNPSNLAKICWAISRKYRIAFKARYLCDKRWLIYREEERPSKKKPTGRKVGRPRKYKIEED